MTNLWPHQKYTIKKLQEIEKSDYNCNFGFLNNKVGSGKSYCILELIKNPCIKDFNLKLYKDIFIGKHLKLTKINYIKNFFFCPINIICVPHNLMHQWKSYIKNYYLTDQTVFICSQICLNKIINSLLFFYINELNFTNSINPLFDNFIYNNPIQLPKIIIVKDTFYNQLFNAIDMKIFLFFDRLFIDEYIHLNNINNYIPAKYIWLVSSSVTSSKNNFINFKQNINIINKISVKIPDHIIDSYINIPEPITIVENYRLTNLHKTFLNSNIGFLIELVNSGLSISQFKHKFNCNETSNIFNKIIDNLQSLVNDKIKNNCDREANFIKQNIDFFKSKIKESQCCICLNEVPIDIIVSACCKNIYCIDCIYNCIVHKITNCSMCRKSLESTFEQYNCFKKLSKIPNSQYDCFIKIFKSITIHEKIVICVNSIKSISGILEYIQFNYNLKVASLSGNEYVITNKIKLYYENKINIIILTADHSGYGFNLQNTNYLIIYDLISDENIKQIIGRCQRFGRKTQLTIFKMNRIL
jgi:hypothetical protein